MTLINALTALGCVLCVSAAGTNVLVKLFQTEIQDCITGSRIPPVQHKDAFVRLILATVQNVESFRAVMNCALLRVKLDTGHPLHNSIHLFDVTATSVIVADLYSKTRLPDWDCVQTRLMTSQCVDMTSSGTTCRSRLSAANTTCTELMSTWNCVGSVNAIIQQFVMVMFGNCLFETDISTTITPVPVFTTAKLPVSSPLPDNTPAFFQCSWRLFDTGMTSLPYLFPSQLTWAEIESDAKNGVDVNARHEQIMGVFCSKVEEYASCVRDRLLTDTGNEFNKRLRAFINVDGLQLQMKIYCDKRQLVASMFKCTLAKTLNSTCNGGLADLLSDIAKKPFKPDQYGERCGEFRKRIKCHVTELTECGIEYGSTMLSFLNPLLRPDCEAGATFTENVDNGGSGGSNSRQSGQGDRNRNGADTTMVSHSLTLTLVQLTVCLVALLGK